MKQTAQSHKILKTIIIKTNTETKMPKRNVHRYGTRDA